MNIRIINLRERMDLLDTVSEWVWREWASDKPLEYVKYQTKNNTQLDRVPMTFVALDGDTPVGTVALWTNDLRCRQDLYPWMASLYVVDDMRNNGIGRQLQDYAIDAAKQLGYEELYLFTDHIGYYERLGWMFMELAPTTTGGSTRIYRIDLTR